MVLVAITLLIIYFLSHAPTLLSLALSHHSTLSLSSYGQLIYLTILGKGSSLPYIRRDTTFLRFLHSTLVSAPQLVIQLYAILLALSPTSPIFTSPINPPILAALGLCILSLVYAILAFTTNDRLSGKNRHVILPAHIVQSLWYLCVVASRVIALAIFAYSYGYWVFVLVAGHWILMFLFLVVQRTTFCADIELQSSSDGSPPQQLFKRRWSLEIPFYFVAASVYIFTFFSMKHGKSWFLLAPFHLLMFGENVAMGVLFYLDFSHLMYAQVALIIVAGLYPVGMFFMVIYYCLCHPRRTKEWYWVGIPRKISCKDCCCWCCLGNKEGHDPIGFRNRTSVVISGPTLISHNGFLPDNMIPVGVPTSSLTEGVSEAGDGTTRRERNMIVENENNRMATDGRMGRMDQGHIQQHQPRNNELSALAIVSPDSTTNANTDVNYMPQRSLTTPSESLPVFSDAPSQLPSELDTDMESNVMREGGHVDTVIDTPLAGFTPEPFDLHAVHMLQHDGRTKSIESQRADTIDTGIELESDIALTPGTTSMTRPDDMNGHHQFLDIPAKRKNYLSERSKLEQHYFPEERHHQQNNGNQRNRDSGSVTPTLPTPNWSPSPASTSPHSGRVTWGQHTTSDSSPERQRRNITPGTLSSQSHPSPAADRSRRNSNAPRSPKGARAFVVNPQGTGYNVNNQMDQNESQMGFPSGQDNKRNIAPRSPKGARRMMVNQQQLTSTTTATPFSAQQHNSVSGQSPERPNSFYPPSPNRSPARLPRGAHSHGGYPHSSPERGPSVPQHIMPQYSPRHSSGSRTGYPVHKSPPRLPRGASTTSSYPGHQMRDDGYGGGGRHNHDSRWDNWTAQNTQYNAAQAAATQIRVEGASVTSGIGMSSGHGGVGRNSGGQHKELSPAVRSENSVDVDRNRSFKIARTTPKANPYYSPYTPKRHDTDPAPQSYPQLRRTTASGANLERPVNYQNQYPRHSGEYNPRFSMEFNNRSHHSGHGGRMSESYPSPGITRNNGPLMAQRSPHYPRTPHGAAARAPRMIRSPPQKRLKSISPQRSILSYGSGAWPLGEGGARGVAMGGSTASATSSRPNSLHSTSALPPLQHHHPAAAARYSDGASAMVWGSQWSTRSTRMNPVLHVPRSSTHESAV